MQITTIGALANWDRDHLVRKLGKMGGMIYDYANGIDEDPVKLAGAVRDIKSVGNGMTFKRDLENIYD